ncbi:MAG: MarR family transcriptional regulator [Candidatus Omnitrophica bacterium]|nr:MarR family transcriptional regulator [Candidatus Omnitrophota bacterium]
MDTLKPFGIIIGKDNPHEQAVYGAVRLFSLLERQISSYLRPFGLTPAKFNAMMIIKHKGKEKGLSQIEVGRQLIVSASNMTRLLDRLEKEGFIERLAQGEDRRVNLVKISHSGSEILDRVWPGYYKRINELAQLLEKKDLSEVARILLSWCGKLESVPVKMVRR